MSRSDTTLSRRERDYLLVTIFVFAQHGAFDRAKTLVDAMLATGDETPEVLLAEAILSFFCEDFDLTLNCLDKLDAMDETLFAIAHSDTARMRTFLRARCHFAQGREADAKAVAAALTEPKKLTRTAKKPAADVLLSTGRALKAS
jgi:hypothetical protein